MSKIRKDESQSDPEHLVQAFAAAGNFPKDREAVILLAQQLKRASEDFHVPMADIVRECVDSSSWCPTPHDLRNIAGELRDKAKKAPLGCQVCQGSGWRSFQKHVDPLNDGKGYMADYADFCDCERGRWMRQCEKDRKTEAATKKGKFHGNDNRATA